MNFESENEISLLETTGSNIKKGEVISIFGDEIIVEISGVKQKLKVAFSCMVQPIIGDIVLCTQQEYESDYILSMPYSGLVSYKAF